MTEERVRELLQSAFEYSWLHDSWVTPLEEALDGLDPSGALWRPKPSAKCIWEIVLHVAVWNENILDRIESGEKSRPAEGAWPPLPDKRTEREWREATERLRLSVSALGEAIRTTPLAKIEASPYGTGDLLCRFAHMAYHIGQIAKMRECMAGA